MRWKLSLRNVSCNIAFKQAQYTIIYWTVEPKIETLLTAIFSVPVDSPYIHSSAWPLCYVCNDQVYTAETSLRLGHFSDKSIYVLMYGRRSCVLCTFIYGRFLLLIFFVLNLFWCPLIYGSDCATHWLIACSRFSDSEEDAKVKGTRKKWRGRKKEKVLPVLFSCSRTRLSRSLKQANWYTAQGSLTVLGSICCMCRQPFSAPTPL